jgi:DNA-binding LacI/PurR family transcriptional regulator
MTKPTYRPPVLVDVARLAGVSVTTVSRVLTQAKYVGPELTERVEAAVKQLGYRPNSAASATRSGRKTLVTVLTGGTGNHGYARTIEGAEAACRRAGRPVMVSVIESADEQSVQLALDLALSQPVAGVVVLDFDAPGRAALHALPPGLPYVVAGGGSRNRGSVPHALLDERAAARTAVEHLLDLGHPTVHYVAGPSMSKRSGRTDGWRSAMLERGIEPPPIMHSTWMPSGGYAWGSRIAEAGTATAVFCGNDDIAMGVMRALLEHGVRIPRDVSVIGFDDQPHVAMLTPALTTVHQDFGDLGERAVHLLEELLEEGRELPASVVAPRLVIRESSGPYRPASRPRA